MFSSCNNFHQPSQFYYIFTLPALGARGLIKMSVNTK